MSADRAKIREDYRSGMSVRMLAAKYGVPKSTVSDWVRRYGWEQESRYTPTAKLISDALSDTLPDTSDSSGGQGTGDAGAPAPPASGDYADLRSYTRKLLQKADQLLELDDALAPRDLKSLSSMLLDVRTLLGVLSPREAAEQELRLAALRKQVKDEDRKTEEQGVVIRFEDTEGCEV